ncbi:hypothetical protein [Crocosphaera sp.]|nr:hypothetical protein [Crocosphaera sp.]MDJ0580237.1 hypothetical protein [Crocosphaera sp.]
MSGDGGKLIRSTIINQGQFATLGCSQTLRDLAIANQTSKNQNEQEN